MVRNFFQGVGLFLALAQEKTPAESTSKKKKKKRGRKDKGGEAAESAKKKKDEKPFDEVVKEMEKVEGLFTFYINKEEGKVLLEIAPDQLDRTYLLNPTLETGIGAGSIGLLSATVLQEYPIEFRRVNKSVQFVIPNIWYRADDNPEMNRALAKAFSVGLLGVAKLESAPHPERNSILVDLSSLFLKDLEGVQPFLKQVTKTGWGFDKEASHFGTIKGFPRNVEIETIHHYKTGDPKPSITLPDPRSMFLTFRYSLAELPESGFRPRYADDRVGTFNTIFQDYSTDRRETAYIRYANRWHLEKEDPNAALSPAREPIVFWLENTIPVEYRDAVRRGTLEWNKAFEKVGIRDAIVVKQQPDDADWDPADIRYNTIRWIIAPGAGFAQGPSRVHPLTGQIFDADIRFSADMIRSLWAEHDELVDPVALMEPPVIENLGHGRGPQYLCNYAMGASIEASFGLHLLAARGLLGQDQEKAREYVNDFIFDVTMHEVGHTLGLRHNFKSSTIHPVDRLQDTELTASMGIAGSVMDYTPVNIATDGESQGHYWAPSIGPYDYWVIEYAYKPIEADSPEAERDELERIARRAAEPYLAYSTDEDTFGFSPRSIDPRSNLWDIGNDPVAYYRGRLAIANELWGKMEAEFEKPGNRYQKLPRVFHEGIAQYFIASLNVPKYVGGIYHNRDHVGDPNGRVPFQPVPVAKQRDALDFLTSEILAADALSFRPELLNKLAPEQQWDFQGSPWLMQRLDYPIHSLVAAIQAPILARLYNPITMSRIVDLEVKYENGDDPFTLAEVFTGVRTAIWSELGAGRDINGYRRNLQRMHLDTLTRLVLEPPAGTPEDAKTLARADLSDIRREIGGALRSGSLDRITRAHLEETGARIDAALEAQVRRRLFPPPRGS